MQITWLGVFLLPFALFVFIHSGRALIYATVASIPFSATAVINSSTDASLFAFQFFAALYIFRSIITLPYKLSNRLRTERFVFAIFWMAFALSIVGSMVSAGLIDGSEAAIIGDGGVGKDGVFELRNIELNETTIKYPFGAFLAIAFSFFLLIEKLSDEHLKRMCSIYIYSVMFLCIWGFFQFVWSGLLGFSYPYYILNTSTNPSALGYEQILSSGFPRISSAALEPSVLAKQILAVLPFILNRYAYRYLFPDFIRFRYFLIVLLIITLILSTSTTALLGLILAVALNLRFSGVLTLPSVLRFAVGISALVGILLSINIFIIPGFLEEIFFEKTLSGSFLSRLTAMENSIYYINNYPYFGVGWGFITTHDLILYLLANTGIIGLISFIMLLWYAFKIASRFRSGNGFYYKGFHSAAVQSLIIIVTIGILTGLEFFLFIFSFATIILFMASTPSFTYKARRINVSGGMA